MQLRDRNAKHVEGLGNRPTPSAVEWRQKNPSIDIAMDASAGRGIGLRHYLDDGCPQASPGNAAGNGPGYAGDVSAGIATRGTSTYSLDATSAANCMSECAWVVPWRICEGATGARLRASLVTPFYGTVNNVLPQRHSLRCGGSSRGEQLLSGPRAMWLHEHVLPF